MAILLNGTNYLNFGNVLPSTTNMSVSAWVYVEAIGARQEIMSKEDAANPIGWELSVQPSGEIEFGVFGSGIYNVVLSGSIITASTWHHVCGVRDNAAGLLRVFIDGIQQNTAAITVTPANNGVPLNIGRYGESDIRYLNGRIGDIRFYDRALSLNEVQTMYISRGHDSIYFGLLMRQTFQEKLAGSNVSPYRASTIANVTSSTALNIDAPTNSNGNLLVAVIAVTDFGINPGPTITAPVGWVQANIGNTNLPSAPSSPSIWIYYKTASSEPPNYTFTSSNAGSALVGTILSYESENISSTPQTIPVIINTGSNDNPVNPSTTADTRSLALRILATDDDDLSGINYPNYVTGRQVITNGGGGNGVGVVIAEQIVPSGATGTLVWDLGTTEEWGAFTMLFNGVSLPVLDISPNGNDSNPVYDPVYVEDVLSLKRKNRKS